jgi:tRNA dimethylallyltransferase
MPNKLLVVIGGPTGVGKTDITIRLAMHYKTSVISADSRQVYNELSIGVGKPSPAQLEKVPHYLIGHTTIFQHYSAGDFTRDALVVLDRLFQMHDIVFMTGGTGLYIKAIMEGFDEISEVPDKYNDHWTKIWKEQGIEALSEALKKADPDYHASVDAANPMRLIRALAVSEGTGKPYSSFRKGEKIIRPFSILPIVLDLPRESLYKRIDQRVLQMIDQGWIEEAKALYPHRSLKALQTVGYNELFAYLDSNTTLEAAISAIQQSTRRYAKRQLTWWRHQGEWRSYSPEDVVSIISVIDQEFDARSKGQGAGGMEQGD